MYLIYQAFLCEELLPLEQETGGHHTKHVVNIKSHKYLLIITDYKMDQNTPTESSQYKSCQQPPEISIEWRDVEIEVKVLGVDLPPQEFVRYTIKLSLCHIEHDLHYHDMISQ